LEFLEPADILCQPVDQHFGNTATLRERAGLIHHIGEVFGTHCKFFIPLEHIDARSCSLESGIGSTGDEERDGDAMWPKFCIETFRELIDTAVDQETLSNLKSIINNVSGVNEIHQLRTRLMAGKILVDVHVLVDSHLSVS
jgi:hypothetical protein